MDNSCGYEEPSIETEFARTIKYIDLYLQQKTDLFLQHYVFEPFDFLIRQILYLSVIMTLLAAGTLALVIGVVLFIATMVPLWAALLITAAIIGAIGILFACVLVSNRIVLKTPITREMIKSGRS
jgi:hypothetical protein